MLAIAALFLSPALALSPVENSSLEWVKEIDPAGWEYVASAGPGAIVLTKAPLAQSGNGLVQIWVRFEFPTAIKTTLSARLLWEFDCAHAMSRIAYLTNFTARNLKGTSSSITPTEGLAPVAPDTAESAVMAKACKLR